jgi:NAD(P)-dependent dehydrogenase (short-subunit alcohol dehydrogenase family)
MELEGKVALVTGAGSGMGRAAALRLAEEGADIAVLSYVESEVTEVCTKIESMGRTALPLAADVSSDAEMKAAFESAKASFGQLDVVYANAGINGVWTPIEDMTVAEWDRVHETNLRGTFLTFHYAIPLMKRKGGSIIVTASITGTTAFSYPGSTAYGATKMAQISYTKSAALELSRYRIRVNAVCPGGIVTNIETSTTRRNLDAVRFPIDYPQGQVPIKGGERGTPEEVAELVLFLASDRSSHITGTPIYIDGGQSLVA